MFTHGVSEDERLRLQGGLLDPITRRLLTTVRIEPGWRVLDLGSGSGNVSLLAAELVGPDGSVVGIDKDAATVERAQEFVAQQEAENVEFRVGDVASLDSVDGELDAVVGRLVYMYLADPVEALRQAFARIRPGGLICLQEADMA